MIDLGALVLGPAMAVFAQPFTLTPVASNPGAPAYTARGSFSFKAVQIPLDDGTYHSTNQPALGVRLSEFPQPPKQDDTIVMAQGSFVIADIVTDGQGGADIWLRNIGDV